MWRSYRSAQGLITAAPPQVASKPKLFFVIPNDNSNGHSWAPYDLDLASSSTFRWDCYHLFAAIAGRCRRWLWHEADCPRVSCAVHVGVRVSRKIIVSVVGPQSAGGKVSAKGKVSVKGKVSTKGKVFTKRADEAMADHKPMTCKAATNKMRAA